MANSLIVIFAVVFSIALIFYKNRQDGKKKRRPRTEQNSTTPNRAAEKKGWRKLVSDLWARIRLALVIAILALAGLSTLFYFYVPGFTDNLTRNVFWLFLLGLFFGLYLSWRKDEGAFRGIAILMGVIALLIIYPIGRRIAENEIKAWKEKQEREAQADKERESGMAQVPSSTEILVLEPGKPSHRIPLEGWRLGIGYTYSMGPLLWQKNCMGEWLDYDPNMEFAGDVYSVRFKAPDTMDLPIEKAPF